MIELNPCTRAGKFFYEKKVGKLLFKPPFFLGCSVESARSKRFWGLRPCLRPRRYGRSKIVLLTIFSILPCLLATAEFPHDAIVG